MGKTPASGATGWLTRWASGLRFPTLLVVIASLFVLDLIIPDLIPFVDEVLLGLFTVLLAALRRRKAGSGTGSAVVTTIDGEGVNRAFVMIGGEHVVIEGFTVQNGYKYFSGAIYIDDGSTLNQVMEILPLTSFPRPCSIIAGGLKRCWLWEMPSWIIVLPKTG